jgi:hypothetical protein
MHVELLVPALFGARGEAALPSLQMLLARGRRSYAEPASSETWLARAFALETDALPAGALTCLAGGGDPGTRFWLRADPVHLELMRDGMRLVPGEAFALSSEEEAALAEAIRRHFAGAFELQVVQSGRWCLGTEHGAALAAASPLEAAGKDVDSNLPAGAEAARWHALLNEIQMLLHAQAVNQAREARGEPPVNSLWLWGAGTLPSEASSRWQSLSGDDPIALGLARLAQMRHHALPATAAQWLERAPLEGRHLVVLDALRAAHALGDDESLLARLRRLEEGWFAPLLAALRSARIGMVTVHVPEAGASFETVRGDLRRFWRRPRPLAKYSA